MDSLASEEERRKEFIESVKEADDNLFQAERILSAKTVDGVEHYLVRWRYWPRGAATWEPQDGMVGCADLLKEWEVEKAAREDGIYEPFDLDQVEADIAEFKVLEKRDPQKVWADFFLELENAYGLPVGSHRPYTSAGHLRSYEEQDSDSGQGTTAESSRTQKSKEGEGHFEYPHYAGSISSEGQPPVGQTRRSSGISAVDEPLMGQMRRFSDISSESEPLMGQMRRIRRKSDDSDVPMIELREKRRKVDAIQDGDDVGQMLQEAKKLSMEAATAQMTITSSAQDEPTLSNRTMPDDLDYLFQGLSSQSQSTTQTSPPLVTPVAKAKISVDTSMSQMNKLPTSATSAVSKPPSRKSSEDMLLNVPSPAETETTITTTRVVSAPLPSDQDRSLQSPQRKAAADVQEPKSAITETASTSRLFGANPTRKRGRQTLKDRIDAERPSAEKAVADTEKEMEGAEKSKRPLWITEAYKIRKASKAERIPTEDQQRAILELGQPPAQRDASAQSRSLFVQDNEDGVQRQGEPDLPPRGRRRSSAFATRKSSSAYESDILSGNPTTTAAPNNDNAFGRGTTRDPLSASKAMIANGSSEPEPPSHYVSSEEVLEVSDDSLPRTGIYVVPYICSNWKESVCREGDDCVFIHAHVSQLPVSTHEMHIQAEDPWLFRKFGTWQRGCPPISCGFWFTGKPPCRHDAETCKFAHWNTGSHQIPFGPIVIAPVTKKAPYILNKCGAKSIMEQTQLMMRRVEPETAKIDVPAATYTEVPAITYKDVPESDLRRLPKSELTCYFWYETGKCQKQAGCQYVHEYRDYGAIPPAKRRGNFAAAFFRPIKPPPKESEGQALRQYTPNSDHHAPARSQSWPNPYEKRRIDSYRPGLPSPHRAQQGYDQYDSYRPDSPSPYRALQEHGETDHNRPDPPSPWLARQVTEHINRRTSAEPSHPTPPSVQALENPRPPRQSDTEPMDTSNSAMDWAPIESNMQMQARLTIPYQGSSGLFDNSIALQGLSDAQIHELLQLFDGSFCLQPTKRIFGEQFEELIYDPQCSMGRGVIVPQDRDSARRIDYFSRYINITSMGSVHFDTERSVVIVLYAVMSDNWNFLGQSSGQENEDQASKMRFYIQRVPSQRETLFGVPAGAIPDLPPNTPIWNRNLIAANYWHQRFLDCSDRILQKYRAAAERAKNQAGTTDPNMNRTTTIAGTTKDAQDATRYAERKASAHIHDLNPTPYAGTTPLQHAMYGDSTRTPRPSNPSNPYVPTQDPRLTRR